MNRSGDEPVHARSALRLRLGLAGFGLVTSATSALACLAIGVPVIAVACAVVALVAVVNCAVIIRHIRQGPHYQPGAGVPPYAPLAPAPHPPPPVAPRTSRLTASLRTRIYLLLMLTCVVMITLSWTVLRLVSMPAAVVTTVIAMTIPPVAAIVANVGWDRRPDSRVR